MLKRSGTELYVTSEDGCSVRIYPMQVWNWPEKETPVSDMTLKYPLWQNHYLQAMAETRPELSKSKISAAEQAVSL